MYCSNQKYIGPCRYYIYLWIIRGTGPADGRNKFGFLSKSLSDGKDFQHLSRTSFSLPPQQLPQMVSLFRSLALRREKPPIKAWRESWRSAGGRGNWCIPPSLLLMENFYWIEPTILFLHKGGSSEGQNKSSPICPKRQCPQKSPLHTADNKLLMVSGPKGPAVLHQSKGLFNPGPETGGTLSHIPSGPYRTYW